VHYTDGPADSATFLVPSGVCVAESGVIFVADYGFNAVRRSRPVSGQRTVTTIAGQSLSAVHLQYACSGVRDFQNPLQQPWGMALQTIRLPAGQGQPTALALSAGAAAESAACDSKAEAGGMASSTAEDGKVDAVRLFVGCSNGVHLFDLARGQHRFFETRHTAFSDFYLTSVLLCGDDGSGTGAGARLLAVAQIGTVYRIDVDSGAVAAVPVLKQFSFWWSAAFDEPIDGLPRSLFVCDTYQHQILRLSNVVDGS
jgi:hypothetical protein